MTISAGDHVIETYVRMRGFDYQPRTRVVFGEGAIDRVGTLARDLGANSVLVVTDGHLVAAGHVVHAKRSLDEAGLAWHLFEDAHENPTTRDVDMCVAFARDRSVDAIIGIGGGSSLDTAKGCNFLLTNGGVMHDYRGVGKAVHPMLPMIAIPTTAGTGSECQSFALIADADTHQKMACGDVKAAPRIALLDPTLTLTQPRFVTANTGIDAIAHAIESAVCTRCNELSQLFSHEAWRYMHHDLPRVLADGDDLSARGRMQLGAAMAGMAIENSMLGAAHSAANPLTARFNVVHGAAVGVMLPHVMAFNAYTPVVRAEYAQMAVDAGLIESADNEEAGVEAMIDHINVLLGEARIPRSLSAYGIDGRAIADLANEAAQQWTAQFNPRPIERDDFERLYHAALD